MRGRIPLPLIVPRRGLITNLPSHEVPPDAVVAGQNMVLGLNGKYQTRPGYTRVITLTDGARVMGGIDYKTAAGLQRTIAATKSNLYRIDTGTPISLTGSTTPTGGNDDHWRFTVFPQAGVIKVIGTNDTNTPQVSNDSGTFADLANAPARARDVLTLSNRLVALNITDGATVAPTRVKWTAVNDTTNWPGTAVANLADADDHIIGGANINRLSAILYREKSQWAMTAQTGTDATAFRFEHLNDAPGPLSAACIVQFGRVHYYLARDFRVYRFDGTTTVPVSDPVMQPIYDRLSPASVLLAEAHGKPFWPLRLILWVLPGTGGTMNRGVWFSPDRNAWEVEGVFAHQMSASFVVASASPAGYQRLYLGATDGKIYELDEADTSDDGTAIAFAWTTPARSEDTRAAYQVERLEDFFTQVATSDEVEVLVRSFEQPYQLEGETVLDKTHHLDQGPLYELQPQKDLTLAQYGRFLQVEYSGSTARRISWAGGFLYVNEVVR